MAKNGGHVNPGNTVSQVTFTTALCIFQTVLDFVY